MEKTVRSEMIDESPFIRGFYVGNASVARHSLKQFNDLKYQGAIELQRFEKYPINRILSFTDNDANIEKVYKDLDQALARVRDILGSLTKTEMMEKSLAEELTFVYYLCLKSDDFFPDTLPEKCNLVRVSESYDSNCLPSYSPIECLSQILKHDREIEGHLYAQIADLKNYQEELLYAMREFKVS